MELLDIKILRAPNYWSNNQSNLIVMTLNITKEEVDWHVDVSWR
jgi:hypothetical protein